MNTDKKIDRYIDLLIALDDDEIILLKNEYKNYSDSYLTHLLKSCSSQEKYNKTFTLTYGDQAENHAGMQKIGKLSDKGFSLEDLKIAEKWFNDNGISTELINLNSILDKKYNTENAYVLIARKGLNSILQDENGADKYYEEQDNLEKDKKAFMYGRVVDKKARHNLCFAEYDQEPDYQNKKGRIIKFDDVPLLKKSREKFKEIIGDTANNLAVEGNYYYDIYNCGIGFHGDSERKKVIGVRVGASMKLRYVWYYKSDAISKHIDIVLNHGDIYIMSQKAVGTDWKSKNIPTLRHSAGCNQFINY